MNSGNKAVKERFWAVQITSLDIVQESLRVQHLANEVSSCPSVFLSILRKSYTVREKQAKSRKLYTVREKQAKSAMFIRTQVHIETG
jgi:hypothetical protein